MGMKPSHVDNHMGSLYGNQTGRFSFLKMALRICGDYGYGYRMYTSADKRVCPKGTPYFLLKPPHSSQGSGARDTACRCPTTCSSPTGAYPA